MDPHDDRVFPRLFCFQLLKDGDDDVSSSLNVGDEFVLPEDLASTLGVWELYRAGAVRLRYMIQPFDSDPIDVGKIRVGLTQPEAPVYDGIVGDWEFDW